MFRFRLGGLERAREYGQLGVFYGLEPETKRVMVHGSKKVENHWFK